MTTFRDQQCSQLALEIDDEILDVVRETLHLAVRSGQNASKMLERELQTSTVETDTSFESISLAFPLPDETESILGT